MEREARRAMLGAFCQANVEYQEVEQNIDYSDCLVAQKHKHFVQTAREGQSRLIELAEVQIV